MALETLHPNGDDDGWPTGNWTDIDEGISSADGATLETTIDDDLVLIDLDDSAIVDADTVTTVSVTIRAKDTSVSAKNSLTVDLFIGGVGKGTVGGGLLTSGYASFLYTNINWDVDWTAAELDGMQIEIKANQTGKGESATWHIDAIDVDIEYTPAAGGLSIPIAMHHYKQMQGAN